MQRKKYENPLIVEELVFQIAPELLDRYLEGDFTCFTQGLEKWPGFMGSEVWVSSDRPGYVRNIVYWKDKCRSCSRLSRERGWSFRFWLLRFMDYAVARCSG